MKNLSRAAEFVLALSLLYCLQSCASFEKAGKNLTKGVAGNADSIGYNLINGAENRFAGEQSKEQLAYFLDSIISVAGLSANRQVKALRDSMLSDKTQAWVRQLMENLAGDSTKLKLAALRNELLGDATAIKLKQLAGDIMKGILNDSTNAKLAKIRDTLLGAQTNYLIKNIVDTAMTAFSQRLKNDINPTVQENVSFIKKYATGLLTTLGALAVGIILLVWRNRERYLKMTTLLAAQIHDIPDQKSYDELTSRIKTSALQAGVEAPLRKMLSANGMLGKGNWQSSQQKKKNAL